jgi:hypothetical protein
MAIGDLAKKAPPPDKLVKSMPVEGEPDDMEESAETEDAVQDGLAEDIIAAGKDPTALRIALNAFLDSRKG